MGYTHYFTNADPPVPERKWKAFVQDVDNIVNDDPNITWEVLTLDGVDEFGYETLVIGTPEAWGFVCAVLLAAYHHGVITSLSSDGSWDDWQDGRDTYTATTNRKPRKAFT